MTRLIIFLIRKKLGLKKYEHFKFTNQKDKKNYYYFTETSIIKDVRGYRTLSTVSLNWLLDNDCSIEKVQYNAIFR